MEHSQPIRVIVPETKGVTALAGISGVHTVLVETGHPIPDSAKNAAILVVGPAEQQAEVDDALQQISQLPHLKLLQTLGQGIEQWDGLLPPQLQISTARGAHGGSAAELVLTTLLALVRDLPRYLKNQQLKQWDGQRSRTIQNSNVLVYGAGDLGQNIRSRLLPFGARVTLVGADSHDDVIDIAAAQNLLPTADAVIMALPLTPATRHIVDAEFLALLRDAAIIINIGRGGLVDNIALSNELRNGRLQAALDVVTPEPLPADSPLWDAPGLILTPHIGGNTDGADDRAWAVAAKQIRAFTDGKLTT